MIIQLKMKTRTQTNSIPTVSYKHEKAIYTDYDLCGQNDISKTLDELSISTKKHFITKAGSYMYLLRIAHRETSLYYYKIGYTLVRGKGDDIKLRTLLNRIMELDIDYKSHTTNDLLNIIPIFVIKINDQNDV